MATAHQHVLTTDPLLLLRVSMACPMGDGCLSPQGVTKAAFKTHVRSYHGLSYTITHQGGSELASRSYILSSAEARNPNRRQTVQAHSRSRSSPMPVEPLLHPIQRYFHAAEASEATPKAQIRIDSRNASYS